jgi:hypothetical protein
VTPAVTALYHLHDGQISSDGIAMQDAHAAVLGRYADRAWCTRGLRRRFVGLRGWDAYRAGGGRRAFATALARDPRRAVGLPAALALRLRVRRRSAGFTDTEPV